MEATRICPGCRKPLTASAPQGLCPECLLKAGLGSDAEIGAETQTTSGHTNFIAPPLEEMGRLFPQLEVLGLIGQGGMGAVYRARQKELDRVVALKILPPNIGQDPAFAERFTREARALAKLNHPGVVTLYEFGRADGLFYFLMEFVDGVNLRQVLEGGRLSAREALAIVPQICDALQYAHDQGIVHRDIKPENILLDRQGRVKVADFGLAKLVWSAEQANPSADASSVMAPLLTEAGKVMGTPQYMAPEQRERPQEVDHRADIYSLGVVLYQMLTGELPGQRIEPPSHKVELDVRLDEVVLRALEREPERRYQQASVVKTDVETIVRTQPVGGTELGSVPAGGSPPKRLSVLAVALCLAGLVLALLLSWLGWKGNVLWRGSVDLTKGGIEREQIVDVLEHPKGPWMAPLAPGGSVELVAVSRHPSLNQPWWRPDGSPSSEGPFTNPGSHSYANGEQQTREFVFRMHNLPGDASWPVWEFHPPASWAGGGQPQTNGQTARGYHLLSATLPATTRRITVAVGVATGDWKTIAEGSLPGSSQVSTTRDGIQWTVSFLKPVETTNGSTVITVIHSNADWQTRVVAVDDQQQEHTNPQTESSGDSRTRYLTATFGGLALGQIKSFRLQARRYHWVEFRNVALNPNESRATGENGKGTTGVTTAPPSITVFGPEIERVVPFGAPCAQHCFQFRSGNIFDIGRGPATTKEEDAEDRKRAADAGGVDAEAMGGAEGLQFVGEGCLFTQEQSPDWGTASAETVVEQLQRATWITGVIELKQKDLPAAYLFKTARGDMGILQLSDIVEDERGYHTGGLKGHGVKLRYKLASTRSSK